MRICPKCGDYYADALLAFCLIDGTPLVSVDPKSEIWSEGTRVIEEKENALRKQKRKLKWRRILMSAMTMLITALVVCVVAVNSLIYLRPTQEESAPTEPVTVATAPAEPAGSITPSTPVETPPTPDTAILTATPTISDPKTNVNIHTNVNANINVNANVNIHANINTHVNANTHTNVNVNANINVNTNTNTDTHADICSDADQSREREIIISRCRVIWRRNIEDDRNKIIAEYLPGIENANASLSEKIGYEITFSKACRAGVVTAIYNWQVTAPTIRAMPRQKEKKFTIVKTGDAWRCS